MFDGDLVDLIDEPIILNGIPEETHIVIDVEDKITSKSETDTPENKLACTLRGLKSMIGEISNMASSFHNKDTKDEAMRKMFNSYIDLLSVINGKAIFCKIGRPIR